MNLCKYLLYSIFLASLGWVQPGVAVAGPNLIENSSFEGGIDYRFAIGRWYVEGLPNLTLDPTTKVHGAVSLKIPLSRPAYRPNTDTSRDIVFRSAVPVLVEAGKTYAFTLYAKAEDRADGIMSVTGYDSSGKKVRTIGQYSFLSTRQWQRKGFVFRPKASGPVEWHVRFKAQRPMDIWLDAIQIEPGLISDYRPAHPIEGGLTTGAVGHIMTSGKEAHVNLRIFNDGSTEKQVNAHVDIYNLVGERVGRVAANTRTKAFSGTTSQLALPSLKNGAYRAALYLEGRSSPESELAFSVLPEPRRIEAENSAFGSYLTVAPEPLSIMRRISMPWIANLTSNGRIIYWNLVEPKEGQFRWYDADVREASRMGFRFMFNLEPCRIPKWAEELSRNEQRRKWANYVSAMAKHYGKTVKYWTIDDEVHASEPCWSSPAEYALWHQAGAEAIRRQIPDAKLLLNTDADVADAVLAKMDAKYVNVLATNYLHLPGGKLTAMTAVGSKHGISDFWAPGVGFTSRPFYLRYWLKRQRAQFPNPSRYWERASDIVLKSLVRTFAHGYSRIFHYTATYVGNTNAYSLFESDSALKPVGVQFGALIWLVDGFTAARPVAPRPESATLRFFRFDRRDGQAVFVLWDEAGGVQRLRLPDTLMPELVLYDQFANKLQMDADAGHIDLNVSHAPTFLMAPASKADRIERVLATAPVVRTVLPKAESIERKGAYALVHGIKDGQQRYLPNIGLWHRSARHGWVEILRSAVSSFPPGYSLDPAGLTISWDIPQSGDNFILKPGYVNVDLIKGARFWHSRKGHRGIEWRSGVVASRTARKSAPAAPPQGYTFLGALNYLIKLTNGNVLKIETYARTAKGEHVERNVKFGGWAMSKSGDSIGFIGLFRGTGNIKTIDVRIQVFE